jgi:hypothetical protein
MCGDFKDREKTHMAVPEGFKTFYLADMLLLLLQAIRVLRQAARAFWRELRKIIGFHDL